MNDATLIGPETIEREDKLLEGHRGPTDLCAAGRLIMPARIERTREANKKPSDESRKETEPIPLFFKDLGSCRHVELRDEPVSVVTGWILT
jgi:hypothetical protein